MKLISLLFPALALLLHVSAQVQTWPQCGGVGWTGPTKCNAGAVCVFLNAYYSECRPESQVPVSTTAGTSTLATTRAVTPTATTTRACPPNAVRAALQPRATGPPIVALDGWAAGSYLQKAPSSDSAILGPASSKGWFLTGGSIRLINWDLTSCYLFLYLNTKSAETSYKPLAFEGVGTAFDWSFNGPNGTLSTPSGFNTFVTCPGGALYLQTGSDLPSGNCTTTRLKVGQ
ncbi:hypothetical protein B0J17DRAFT_657343 [Rhizoctonia solani]|nr:hypothetical protein B0J17DRAFT_657343 [Rhizoctonia solani]